MRTFISTLILIGTLSMPAAAQSPIVPAIPPEQTVWVTTNDGFEVQGGVISLTADAIEVSTKGGMRRLAMRDVHVIEKKDSNKNGFWIGFAVGASPILALGGPSAFTSRLGLAYMTFGGVVYGSIGWLIDNAIEGRDEIYRRDTERIAINVAPIIGLGAQKRVGVGGSFSWR